MLSSYDSVKYESASSLVVLAPDSAVVAKLVITCYVDLLKKETDNSAKLAILSNIERVLRTDPSVLGDSLMNIFGIDDRYADSLLLARSILTRISADIDISEKIVKLVLHSTTSSNVESVVNTFGKELTKPSIRTVDEVSSALPREHV